MNVAPGPYPGARVQVAKEWVYPEDEDSEYGQAGTDEDDQRSPPAVDELMDLGAQPATGTANAVVRRLGPEIRVIRPSPLCGG